MAPMRAATDDGNASADLAPADLEKLAALKRTKRMATGALVLCVLVFVIARIFEADQPWLGFVAAFAEAAAIGGLADWYAVVALFRRPLGLPIPHTAIIPSNQERIADNLGRFIERNFLAAGPVRAKLAEVDFAAMVTDWLADRSRADGLSGFVMRLLPQSLSAVEDSGLKRFAAERVSAQLAKVEIAPLAADLMASFTADGRHQGIFDSILRAFGDFLSDEAALATMREKIREELPTIFNLFRADAYLLRRIVRSAASLIEEVHADPRHPLRREFDELVANFIVRLRHSHSYAVRAEKLKHDFLARPEFARLADEMWAGLRDFVEQDAAQPDSVLRRQLGGLFVDVGRQLARDRAMRDEMNRGFVVALASFVESQKPAVATFIADQVKSWDLGQLTRLIEINVGRDLQYIRFNGMIIGGIAGLLLHSADMLFIGD